MKGIIDKEYHLRYETDNSDIGTGVSLSDIS